MNIKIIFDNEALNKNICAGWGFSALIDGRILFDTGEKEEYLLKNMAVLGVDSSLIEAVVISHDHWDHTNGLWGLLKKHRGMRVYGCPGFSEEFRKKVIDMGGRLIEAGGFDEISNGIFSTGDITGYYKNSPISEQSLGIKTKNGITVVTGCAHPGVAVIVEKIKERFPGEKMNMVLGGFHLSKADTAQILKTAEKLQSLGVQKAGPAHCSGGEARRVFKQIFGTEYVEVKAGIDFNV